MPEIPPKMAEIPPKRPKEAMSQATEEAKRNNIMDIMNLCYPSDPQTTQPTHHLPPSIAHPPYSLPTPSPSPCPLVLHGPRGRVCYSVQARVHMACDQWPCVWDDLWDDPYPRSLREQGVFYGSALEMFSNTSQLPKSPIGATTHLALPFAAA